MKFVSFNSIQLHVDMLIVDYATSLSFVKTFY